ncbi:hypothetical protein J2X06_001228 [Lysobacter niastensis]|uniref:Transposase n=1 Tax=Lysobacter niastensis TaxID=380629 RepID=A0ABU1W8Z7_9GAMM|nr:hypothetical protein [Lysobacter niastensis]
MSTRRFAERLARWTGSSCRRGTAERERPLDRGHNQVHVYGFVNAGKSEVPTKRYWRSDPRVLTKAFARVHKAFARHSLRPACVPSTWRSPFQAHALRMLTAFRCDSGRSDTGEVQGGLGPSLRRFGAGRTPPVPATSCAPWNGFRPTRCSGACSGAATATDECHNGSPKSFARVRAHTFRHAKHGLRTERLRGPRVSVLASVVVPQQDRGSAHCLANRTPAAWVDSHEHPGK